ncbi:MAG: hypothetical protein Q9162_003572 [Coniocarpon cinnabarinum]
MPALGLPQAGYPSGGDKQALYFLQNNPSGASVIALELENGQAGNPIRTSTQGIGSGVMNLTSNEAVDVDTLNSQGAVAVGGDYLFAVNSGSNTLAMFKIDSSDPTHPQMMGQPIDSQGDFPVSVTYSDKLGTVCVVNGGARNNVACWKINNGQLCQNGDPRPLNLGYLNTPPVQNSGTVSQIQFSPDAQHLVVSVKGLMAAGTPGPVFIFPVLNDEIAQEPVRSTIADILMPFGFAFGSDSDRILLSDPTFGGSIVTIDPSTSMTSELQHTMSNLTAACWAAYSSTTKNGYLIDAGAPQMGEVDMTTGALLDVFQTDPAFVAAFDAIIDGSISYFLARAPSVGSFDVGQRSLVQNLDLANASGVDDRQWWSGLAMYPSK